MRSRGRVLLDPKVLGASSDLLFGLQILQVSGSAIYYLLNLGGVHLVQLSQTSQSIWVHIRMSCLFVKGMYDR